MAKGLAATSGKDLKTQIQRTGNYKGLTNYQIPQCTHTVNIPAGNIASKKSK